MKQKTLATCLGALILASACSHEVYYNYEGAKNVLFDVSKESPGANCVSGGQRLRIGVDTNNDGHLSWDEVTTTQYVCDGRVGAKAGIFVTELTEGIVCPYGGQRIDLGIDADGNGILSGAEIEDSHYICNDSRAEGWSKVTQLSAMDDFTCALLANQDVACWGRSTDLLDQAAAPVIVSGLSKALQATPGCALITDGTVECWSGVDSAPRRIPNVWTATSIAGSATGHVCAVLEDKTVWCWGNNDYGQLGNGTTLSSSDPVPVFSVDGVQLKGVAQVAVGARHSCAVLQDKTAWCWGDNGSGQLGNGNMDVTASGGALPVQDSNGKLGSVSKIALGDDHSCAQLTGGTVQCWGSNEVGQLGDSSKVGLFMATAIPVLSGRTPLSGAMDLAVGARSACVVLNSGNVSCWGDNSRGQLGVRTKLTYSAAPVQVKRAEDGQSLYGVKSIALGGRHACSLSTDNSVHCWGRNRYGQMGNGQTLGFEQTSTRPVVFDAYAGTSMVLGELHGCMLLADGTVECWGLNERGQLGESQGNAWLFSADPLPVTLPPVGTQPSAALSRVAHVATGPASAHTCAVLEDETAWCWGANGSAQLGDGSSTLWKTLVQVVATPADEASSTPAVMLSSVKDIATGRDHTCAVIETSMAGQRRVDCWGANGSGQLGNGSSVDSAAPVTTSYSEIINFTNIVAGDGFTCGRAANTYGYCWGSNSHGQLGINLPGAMYMSSPVAIALGVDRLVAGGQHACALWTSGTADCWGRNDSGQLGNNTNFNSYVPQAVTGLSGIASMSLGYHHSCAVLQDKTVWCWGNNVYGQLGDGTTTNRLTPVKVSGVLNAVSVSCGTAHTCVTLDDGSARCWGWNNYAQLGTFPGQLGAIEGAFFP